MSPRVLCLFVCCCVLALCSLNFAKGLTQFSTQNVKNLMEGKKQQLQQVRDALMETSILSVACEKFGNSSSMCATLLSGKSATSNELSDVLTSLEYEVDVVQKLFYEMKSKEEALLAEKQAAEKNAAAKDVANESGDLEVIGASWGKNDVLKSVKSILSNGDGKSFTPSSSQLGDGLPGWTKVLYVVLKSKSTDQYYYVIVTEGSTFNTANRQLVPTPTIGRNGISIICANYGPSDMTLKVRSIYNSGSSVGANNELLGDTWYGVFKTMTIVYKKGSSYFTIIAPEHESLL